MADGQSAALYHLADDRGILCVTGDDARSFLQGLVSADVQAITPTRGAWAALLTPQGKFLFDLFIGADGDRLLLDCERERRDALAKKLSLYRLRADVAITDRSDELAVALVWGDGALSRLGLPAEAGAARGWTDGVALVDPRLPDAGARVIGSRRNLALGLEVAGLTPGARQDWEHLRIGLGLPDGSRDLTIDKAILLENGFDELGAIAWDKGCWMGQELTARTRYRGLVKKRLLPVRVDGDLPPPGTLVLREGREVGEVRSGMGDVALALLRLDALDAGAPLTAGPARLAPVWPSWARRPDAVGTA